MSEENGQKSSQLIPVLREGIALVQMVFFKEMRAHMIKNYPDRSAAEQSMLAGAITNEIFGTPNPDPKFMDFRQQNHPLIEQELLGVAANFNEIRRYLTDALRVQTLCDSQEGKDTSDTLTVADKLGILLKDRDIPLPSVFMTLVRGLGQKHNLITPPVQIAPEDDKPLVQ